MPSSSYSAPPSYPFDDFIIANSDGLTNANHLLNSIVVPRPIAFISSVGLTGVVNAAPFSYFNIVCTDPAMISVSIEREKGERKDTARNIIAMKEFVVNICSIELANAITLASKNFSPDISEIDVAQLSLLPSHKIKSPRIANTLAQLECVLEKFIEVGDKQTELMIAKVVTIHVHRQILNTKGRIEISKLNPLARLSGITFAILGDSFDISRDSF